MSSRNPLNMANDEIVGEITHLRDGIDHSSRRILELSRSLHDRMRRDDRRRIATNGPSNERTSIYLTYANLWSRFAGMVQQGLQRSRQADRVLRLLPDDPTPQREAAEVQPTAQEAAPEAQAVPSPSPLEDFITLYGEEMIRDAAADGQRER
jgi:hypothetical protein